MRMGMSAWRDSEGGVLDVLDCIGWVWSVV